MAQILTDTYTYVIFWTKITAVSFVVLGGRCSDVRRSRDSLKQILRHLVNIMDSYYDQYKDSPNINSFVFMQHYNDLNKSDFKTIKKAYLARKSKIFETNPPLCIINVD